MRRIYLIGLTLGFCAGFIIGYMFAVAVHIVQTQGLLT